MIIEKLRAATAHAHKELDEWLMPIFSNLDSTAQYAELLRAFYSFFKPLMLLIDEKIDTRYLPDYPERRRPDLIINDLMALNMPYNIPDMSSPIPFINDAADAMGTLYVLEGSTLGGVYLCKMLEKKLDIKNKKGLSFFYGYGDESRARWDTFILQINLFAQISDVDDQILHAAKNTFEHFKRHLQLTL